jgi:hypothetical protein
MNAAWHVIKPLLVVAAAAVVITPWVLAARSLTSPLRVTQPSASIPPRSVVWANRVFSSRSALASWLAANGASYKTWASHHRIDAAILEHAPAKAFTPPRQTAAATSHRSNSAWARIGLLAVATLLMLAALIPADLAPLPAVDWLSATRRTYVFAVGFALCVGVLIAGVQA